MTTEHNEKTFSASRNFLLSTICEPSSKSVVTICEPSSKDDEFCVKNIWLRERASSRSNAPILLQGHTHCHKQVLRNFRVPNVTIKKLKLAPISKAFAPLESKSPSFPTVLSQSNLSQKHIHANLSQPNLSQTLLSQPNLLDDEKFCDLELPCSQEPTTKTTPVTFAPMLLSDDDLSDKKEPLYCWKSVLGVEKKCNGFQARIQWTSKKDGINHNESMEPLSSWTNHDNRLREVAKWAARDPNSQQILGGHKKWKQIKAMMLQMGWSSPRENKEHVKGENKHQLGKNQAQEQKHKRKNKHQNKHHEPTPLIMSRRKRKKTRWKH